MILEYEKEFVGWLMNQIKYVKLEIPKGYKIVENIPEKDYSRNLKNE